MVSKGADTVVLWPRYFDAKLSRGEGRRVPARFAVKDPDVKWIYSACRKAGFFATTDDEVKDPARPYRVVGRVLVTKPEDGQSKEAVVQAVGQHMVAAKED